MSVVSVVAVVGVVGVVGVVTVVSVVRVSVVSVVGVVDVVGVVGVVSVVRVVSVVAVSRCYTKYYPLSGTVARTGLPPSRGVPGRRLRRAPFPRDKQQICGNLHLAWLP